MNDQMTREVPRGKKKIIIFSLYLGTLIIFFLGIFFSTFSVLNKITFQVLNTSVPGAIFGLLVAYLGLRYFFEVSKFKTRFYDMESKFSWSNFRRNKVKFANILK